jgi:three-Cys-motif partner protein
MATNKNTWGGTWTEKKLDAFEKYVNAYLTIMNKYRDKFSWKLIYFDAFAGSGARENISDSKTAIKPIFDIQPEEISVYKGAAEKVLNIQQRGFDYYYFIDKNEESSNKLKHKLQSFENTKRLEFRAGEDANQQIQRLAEAMKKDKSLTTLALLDPFGMQVDWSSVELLKDTRTDLWILIPTGVIVNRLLDRKGKLTHIDKLVSFFGLSEEEIRNYFYQEMKETTLFGEDTIVLKCEQAIRKITELYISRLKGIFKEVTEQPLELKNTRNCPIFHFAFASNNVNAKKIAKQIIGRN